MGVLLPFSCCFLRAGFCPRTPLFLSSSHFSPISFASERWNDLIFDRSNRSEDTLPDGRGWKSLLQITTFAIDQLLIRPRQPSFYPNNGTVVGHGIGSDVPIETTWTGILLRELNPSTSVQRLVQYEQSYLRIVYHQWSTKCFRPAQTREFR